MIDHCCDGELTERYSVNLHGVLSCYDCIIVTGTLPGACYAGRMTSFLYAQGIRIFDYARFAEPLRERIRHRAQEVCAAGGIQIEHAKKSHIRKEELVARVLAARGDAPGLVHVISAMESCPSYKPFGNTKVVERVVVDRYTTAYPAVGIVLTAQARDFTPAAHPVERGVQPQREQNARVDCSTPRRSATRLDGIEQPAQVLTHDIAPNKPRTMALSKQ